VVVRVRSVSNIYSLPERAIGQQIVPEQDAMMLYNLKEAYCGDILVVKSVA
jgi:hypothetical protein